ncbi:MAG TPA: ABC transporter permease [Mycobacteriales bacterium]|nr:ABC transporter permease [Mycobacteriales bacterium]
MVPLAAGAPVGSGGGFPGAGERVLANDSNSLIWWHYVRLHLDDIGTALGQHIRLTAIAVGVGLLVSVPLALLARRFPLLAGPILAVSGVLYTVPSIALLYLLGPLTGFTTLFTVETALVTYTLLILVRNILTGLDGVSDDVKEAARGMGYTDQAMLWRVEVPLALPSIMAGVRIATVTTIGLASLAALLAQGGLGDLILDGIGRRFSTPLMVGSVLVIALAVVADLLLLGVQKLVTPWSRVRRSA